MKEFNLRQKLQTLKDKQRRQAIDIVLMITLIATMSGYQGYRAIGYFAQRYKKEIIITLPINNLKIFIVYQSVQFEFFS